jgi:hypothetical protein
MLLPQINVIASNGLSFGYLTPNYGIATRALRPYGEFSAASSGNTKLANRVQPVSGNKPFSNPSAVSSWAMMRASEGLQGAAKKRPATAR